jgi:5-oxoprolinase (ATP-hydrolysing)
MVEVCLAGGAGFGDPRERPAEKVNADIADGYVSPQGALTYRPRAATAAE